MFTGIIECIGEVKDVFSSSSNRIFWIESPLTNEFKVDQSVSHNGVCLTVEEINGNRYRVTAIDETLKKSNLGQWKSGTLVNIERCLPVNGRLDGHFVQGHVDSTGNCISKIEKRGSWELEIEFPDNFADLVVEKGSISLNGISLTIFNVKKNQFSVGIIPYTFDNTNIKQTEAGDILNLEFDILGKYILRNLELKA